MKSVSEGRAGIADFMVARSLREEVAWSAADVKREGSVAQRTVFVRLRSAGRC
jgi:hypothetical protein